MFTSPRAAAIGLPTFSDSIRASSSRCVSTSSASRRRRRARSAGVTARQAGNAAFAAATAASVSSTPACSSSASGSSVAGLRTVRVTGASRRRCHIAGTGGPRFCDRVAQKRSVAHGYTCARRPSYAPLGPEPGRLRDELVEQACVLARLGMPQNADREPARRLLEGLDRAVVGARRDAQALADAAVALMMVRLHRHARAEQPAETGSRLELDLVVGEHPRGVLVLLVADLVGQVLDEVAAERDVQHL